MLNLTKAELSEKAIELNFTRDTLEKALRLAEILTYLNTNPIMKDVLPLKGGTAINFTIFKLPRLSVDIDLDFHSTQTREEMLQSRTQITIDIETHMKTQEYTREISRKPSHSLEPLVFSYRNLGGSKDNIKIEINYSLRSHIFPLCIRSINSELFDTSIRVLCLDPIEIFASKINALINRAAARDLYDIHNMISFDILSESDYELLRKATIFYTAISQESIPNKYDFSKIEQISSRKIKTELQPVIYKNESISLESMKAKVVAFLSQLLTLSAEEDTFLTEFSNNNFLPELLFEDEELLARIRNHPMALWKTRAPGSK
jgi:predicted nucleotidyltransferase component of viral defense system